jgi:hypothetical protein
MPRCNHHDVNRLGPFNGHSGLPVRTADRLDMFPSETLRFFGKRQELIAEPRHMLLNREPHDVFQPSTVLLPLFRT